MAKEIVIPISLDAKDAPQTLADLRKQVSGLTDDLVSLERGTDAYDAKVQDIEDTQRQYAIVLNDSREATKRANDEIQKLGKAPNYLKDLQSEANRLKQSLGDVSLTQEQYTQRLVEYGKVASMVSNIQQDARNATLTTEQQLNNVIRVTGSLAAGISAAQAATALFGVENEALAQTLVKVQASVALFQSIKGLAGLQKTIPALTAGFRTLTAGVTGFQKALIATGVGAFVVAIGVLIAYFDELTAIFKKNENAITSLNDQYAVYNRQIKTLNNDLDLNIRILQAQGATEEQLLIQRRKDIAAIIEQTEAILDQYNVRTKLTEQEIKERDELLKNLQGYYANQQKLNNDATILEYKQAQDRLSKLNELRQADLKQIESVNEEIRQANNTAYQNELLALQKTYEDRKKLLEKYGKDTTDLTYQYTANREKIESQEAKRLNDLRLAADQEYINNIRTQNDRILNEIENSILEIQAKYIEAQANSASEGTLFEIQKQIEEQERLLFEARENYLNEYRAALQDYLVDETLSKDQRLQVETDLQETRNQILLNGINERIRLGQLEIAAKEVQKQKEKEIDDDRADQEEKFYRNLTSLLSSTASIIGESTVTGKALSIAGATIDTYRAAANALATVPFPYNIAAVAAVAAAGAAQVKKIVSVKIPNVTDNTMAPSITPSQVIRDANVDDIVYPEIIREANTRESTEEKDINNAVRVYVTETDISNAITKVNVVESESTF